MAEPTFTLRIQIPGESRATSEIRPFVEFIHEFLNANECSRATAERLLDHYVPGHGWPMETRVRPLRTALRTRDTATLPQSLREAQDPLGLAAMLLCCLAERYIHEVTKVDETPNGRGSARWWQLMYWLARLEGDIDAHRATMAEYIARQKRSARQAHALGDAVRDAVLAAFDARSCEWRNYSRATDALWREFGGATGFPWDQTTTMRKWLAKVRPGAYPRQPGRPKRHQGTH